MNGNDPQPMKLRSAILRTQQVLHLGESREVTREQHKRRACWQAKVLAPVVQTLDSVIHRINLHPAVGVIDFRNTFPLDSDLSGGSRYPAFEQPGPAS